MWFHPLILHRWQSFMDELSLALSSPVPDAVIFYTLDGPYPLYSLDGLFTLRSKAERNHHLLHSGWSQTL